MRLLLVFAGALGVICVGRKMDRWARTRRVGEVQEVARWEEEGGATPAGAATQSA